MSKRPKTYDSRERLMAALVDKIYSSGMTFKQLAEEADLAVATVHRLASGGTQWPRPKTLFSIIEVLDMEIEFRTRRR